MLTSRQHPAPCRKLQRASMKNGKAINPDDESEIYIIVLAKVRFAAQNVLARVLDVSHETVGY